MADQVIGFLQDIAAAVMAVWHRRELPHREVEAEIIRPPMFEGNWGNKPERCLVDDAFKGLVADPVVRSLAAKLHAKGLHKLFAHSYKNRASCGLVHSLLNFEVRWRCLKVLANPSVAEC